MKYFLGLVGFAYLLGSIPTGLVVARLMGGPDPRQAGSGNVGAANLFRLLGRNAGVFTFLGDTLKGALPVFLAVYWLTPLGAWHDAAVAAVGLAAVLGHIFPVFLKFQGGKAVASFIGAFLMLTPVPLLAALVVFVIVVAATRQISMGSIVASGTLPLAVWLVLHPPAPVLWASAVAAIFVIYRHRANIGRIRAGTEHVFRFK